MTLFSADESVAPLAARMRPRTLGEFVGQQKALAKGGPVSRLLAGDLSSVILWGPPGTGKTTLALLIAKAGKAQFVELSAVSAGVKDVRDVIAAARTRAETFGTPTVLFIDEVHRFSKTQQDALLPAVEHGWVTLVAATTENPAFSVISPLLSRSLLVTLESLGDDDIAALVDRALADERGFAGSLQIVSTAEETLVRLAGGDARRAFTLLEAAAAAAVGRGSEEISADDLALASATATVRYDRDGDQHYDVISAFIKSVRGSDVDAALHYLARMIAAGEDARFIARRLIILASEDIGLADNSMLPLAVAAGQTVALVGLPEAQLALAQATIALALAPKSNSVTKAMSAALADVQAGLSGAVPAHLRDSHYARAGQLGHGIGYQYPHDLPGGIAAQDYAPIEVANRQYYLPTEHGAEAQAGALWRKLRSLLGR